MQAATPAGAFERAGSRLRGTALKVFGVTLSGGSDRPYVFVKLETNQGIVGWGEGTLEGKAGAVIACVNDFRDLVVGADPMQVEHIWQSRYVHSLYRAGPAMGSAISGIDQALRDIRRKALGMPVYKLLGGPSDSRGVRGYYHAYARTREDLQELRETAVGQGGSCFKSGPLGVLRVGRDAREKPPHRRADCRAARGAWVRHRHRRKPPRQDQPQRGFRHHQELEPLNLLFVEEPCPPENVKAMARIARRSTTPLATCERLAAAYGVRELIELGVADILQTDINHAGGISALWKAGAMAEAAGNSMAPHACEGPLGGIATLHVDAAMPNFLVQEICGGVRLSAQDKVWEEWLGFLAMRMVNGRFPLPEKPGLGFEPSEAALARYPFASTKPMAPWQNGSGRRRGGL